MKATYKPIIQMVGNQSISLEPGQFIFGRNKCSKETGLSEKKVRNCLHSLKTASNLAIKTANKYSIISILNWDSYQADEFKEGQQDGQQEGQQRANKGPTKGHKQEVTRKLRIKRKEIIYPPDFELFWLNYPRKAKKDDALKAWIQRNGSRPPVEVLNSKVNEFKQTKKWREDNGDFIPYPATWLRGGCWNDEVKCEVKSNKAPTWADYDREQKQ